MERANHGRTHDAKKGKQMTLDTQDRQVEDFTGDALDAYRLGQFDLAFAMWMERAEEDDPDAAAWIGSCYANGDGVDVDDSKALRWYTVAAELGNPMAQANVGAFHYMGRGVDKSTDKAIEWLSRAADGGDLNGLFNLAQLYQQGAGGEPDLAAAADLYRKAAEVGHYPSQSRLGDMCARGDGVKKDRIQAYLWLTLAAQHGIGTALNALESVTREMSAEEKAQGAGLFEQWRFKTRSAEGPVALYPSPS